MAMFMLEGQRLLSLQMPAAWQNITKPLQTLFRTKPRVATTSVMQQQLRLERETGAEGKRPTTRGRHCLPDPGGGCCLVAQLCPTLLQHHGQAPLSLGFSRQEYWSGLPFPPPGDLPDPGIEPMSAALAGRFFTTEPPRRPLPIPEVKLLSRVRLFAPPQTDYSLPGFSVHGIFQVRILEWVAISFSRRSPGSNPGLPHRRQALYRLSHQGSPNPWTHP